VVAVAEAAARGELLHVVKCHLQPRLGIDALAGYVRDGEYRNTERAVARR
jgi:hypothetical protein